MRKMRHGPDERQGSGKDYAGGNQHSLYSVDNGQLLGLERRQL
jgi:hypothetical protein